MDQTKDRIRFVPYRALGAEDGLLAVMDVDEMILQDGRQMRRYEHMAVGIAQKGLLEDKEYDLHPWDDSEERSLHVHKMDGPGLRDAGNFERNRTLFVRGE